MIKSFDELIAEADRRSIVGWEFSVLEDRWVEEPPSWNLRSRIETLLQGKSALLDMGTGGGEFLQSLLQLPEDTTATEAFSPNVAVARANLEPLGIRVVDTTAGPSLPFADRRFDLVVNRHEAFEASDVFRILKPGGRFITQQVGGRDMRGLNELLQDSPAGNFEHYNRSFAASELETAGFQILELLEEYPAIHIYDVGAIVIMLKVTPWQIDDFSIDRYHDRLRGIHESIQQNGRLTIQSHRFVIDAIRP